MKIRRIAAYRVELPLHEGSYSGPAASPSRSSTARSSASRPTRAWSATARSARSVPLTCPAYAEGVRAGIATLAPHLIGEDPRSSSG